MSHSYCFNIKNHAITEWPNNTFMRVWRLGSVYYGIRPDGIYVLGGDMDEGVPVKPGFTVAQNRYGSTAIKTLDYLRVDCDAGIDVTTNFDNMAGSSVNATTNEEARRIKLGKGAEGRNVGISIKANTGANFVIRMIEIYLKERLRGNK